MADTFTLLQISELNSEIDNLQRRILNMESPFKAASHREKRLKLFLWGESGSGKTTLSLRFPDVAMIDMEGGSAYYADSFKFSVMPATTVDEVYQAIEYLATERHSFKTLVIDPVTIFNDSLQKKWSDRLLSAREGSKHHHGEFYDMQPKDWMGIREEFKGFLRQVVALDMNVVVTARSKPLYAEGELMKKIGETHDGDKSLPYMFDCVLQLVKRNDDFFAVPIKDRTGKLPKTVFKPEFSIFKAAFGSSLEQSSEPLMPSSREQQNEIMRLTDALKVPPNVFRERLESYGATSVTELSKSAADIILGKLSEAARAKGVE